jgi:hypothetical protein
MIGGFIGKSIEIRRSLETLPAQTIWLFLLLFLYSLIICWYSSRKPDARKITAILNTTSVILILSVFVTSIEFIVEAGSNSTNTMSIDKWKNSVDDEPCEIKNMGRSPDIYYIILDGYARDDTLQNIYSVDNSPFINSMEKMGFVVTRNSISNYKQTNLSIASSLNMDYLDALSIISDPYSSNETPLYSTISNNRVIHQLRCLNYKIVAFESGDWFTELSSADSYFSPGIKPNSFESMLLDTTPASILLIGEQYRWHRERILYELDTLPDVAVIPGPKFVFVHIMSPHPPFILGENGEEVYPQRMFSATDGNFFMAVADQGEYVDGYHDQIIYLTKKVETTIHTILNKSDTPPIIILQGDHGPASQLDAYSLENTNITERMTILNAYYLPYQNNSNIDQGISPVNTFRLVFNTYFGAKYSILPDRSYYSLFDTPFNFIDVTNQIKTNPNVN